MEKILITGTSSGIGLNLAKYFINKNYLVYGISRTNPDISSEKYKHFKIDLSNLNSLKEYYDTLRKLKINHFIHNAGMLGELKKFQDCDLEIWQKVFNVNLFSGVNILNNILKSLIDSKGCIIFMAGGGSTTSLEKWSSYSTSKTALVRFIENIADEYKDTLHAYALSPGVNETKIMRDAINQGFVYDKSKIVSPELSCKLCKFLIDKKEYFLSGTQIHVKDDYSKWTINDIDSDKFKLRRITNF